MLDGTLEKFGRLIDPNPTGQQSLGGTRCLFPSFSAFGNGIVLLGQIAEVGDEIGCMNPMQSRTFLEAFVGHLQRSNSLEAAGPLLHRCKTEILPLKPKSTPSPQTKRCFR
jgi:hypothetical protein